MTEWLKLINPKAKPMADRHKTTERGEPLSNPADVGGVATRFFRRGPREQRFVKLILKLEMAFCEFVGNGHAISAKKMKKLIDLIEVGDGEDAVELALNNLCLMPFADEVLIAFGAVDA